MGTTGSTPNATRQRIQRLFSELEEPLTPLHVFDVDETDLTDFEF